MCGSAVMCGSSDACVPCGTDAVNDAIRLPGTGGRSWAGKAAGSPACGAGLPGWAGQAAVAAAKPGRQVGRARPGGAGGVAGVGDGASLQRQAAAPDARVEAVPQGGERADLVVEALP